MFLMESIHKAIGLFTPIKLIVYIICCANNVFHNGLEKIMKRTSFTCKILWEAFRKNAYKGKSQVFN